MITEQETINPKIDAIVLEDIIESKSNITDAIHFPPSSAHLYLFNYHDISISEREFEELANKYNLIVEYDNNPVILSTTLDIIAKNYDKLKESGNGHKTIMQIPIKVKEVRSKDARRQRIRQYDLKESVEEINEEFSDPIELESLFDSPERTSLEEEEEVIEEDNISTLQRYMKDVTKYKVFEPEEERDHAKRMYLILEQIAKDIFNQRDFMYKYLQLLFNPDQNSGSFRSLMPNNLFGPHNPAKRGLKEIIMRSSGNKGIKEAKSGDLGLIKSLSQQRQDRNYLIEIYNNLKFAQNEISKYDKVSKKGEFLKELGFKSEKNLELFIKDLESKVKDHSVLFNEFVNRNYRLVVKIAHKYRSHNSTELMDLIQEGNIGLIRAAERFDFERGYKFSVYATWWIHQAIIRSLQNNKEIRVPIYLNQRINNIIKLSDKITKEKGIDATPDDIAEHLGISVEEVSDLLQLTKKTVSLHQKINNEDTELIELIKDEKSECPEGSSINKEAFNIIEESLKDLSLLEKKIMKMRYCLGEERRYTLQEIADQYEVSRQRISQIEHKVLRRLRLNPGSLEKLSDLSKPLKLDYLLKMLTKRQLEIVRMKYGIRSNRYTRREIGKKLGITKNTVNHTIKTSLIKMDIEHEKLISLTE